MAGKKVGVAEARKGRGAKVGKSVAKQLELVPETKVTRAKAPARGRAVSPERPPRSKP